jgi:isoleucyl-tRNA synthetase
VQSRPDWCISRQRTWGVPIPAFYDAQGNPILDPQIIRNAANLIEQHGSNVWFEKTAAELWSILKPKNWTGPDAVVKSNDTLDVWIDSGSSSRAVLMGRPELQRPLAGIAAVNESTDAVERVPTKCSGSGHVLGSDQHRGWFQSSLSVAG